MSSFSAYTASRTPVLDGQLENAVRDELPLSASEAHLLASLMLDGRAPLRTPALDGQPSIIVNCDAKVMHTREVTARVISKQKKLLHGVSRTASSR